MLKTRAEPKTIQLTGVEAQQFVVNLLRRALVQHADQIAELGPGNILVVAYEPAPRARAALEAMGHADTSVFVLGEAQRRTLAKTDYVTERWVREPPAPGCLKILLIAGSSTLLVNYTGGSGWSIEEDSTDNTVLN
jgi:hypothetical protein